MAEDAADTDQEDDVDWGAAADTTEKRVLSQDEIDSLLGIDTLDDDGDDARGVMALINSGLINYERLPMLDIVFDRLVRMMSTSLRNFMSDNVEVSLDQITAVRFGDYLNAIPLPTMLTIFKAEEWDNFGLINLDSSLIYSVIDVLLGGRRGTAAMRIEGRPYTTIERALIERMLQLMLGDLSAAFDPLSPVTFRFDRLETNPRFASIARPANAAVLIRLRIDMEDRGGRAEIIIPYATLEPVRELLLQMFMGEKFGRDSIWETHLANELWYTDVQLSAVLAENTTSIDKVLDWRIGTQIVFNTSAHSPVELRCGDVPLFSGHVGRKSGFIAIKIKDDIDRNPE